MRTIIARSSPATGFVMLLALVAGAFPPLIAADPSQADLAELEKLSREVEACQADVACITRMIEEIEQKSQDVMSSLPTEDKPARAVVPAFPVLAYPEGKDPRFPVAELKRRFLSCGQDQACLMHAYEESYTWLDANCGRDMVCKGIGQTDLATAQALANIERQARTVVPDTDLHEARPERTEGILNDWRQRLERALPAEMLRQAEQYANSAPLITEGDRPPLQFDGNGGDLRASSRDWAYALQGAMFLQLGLSEKQHAQFLDLAMWCFVRSAQLNESAAHLSNIAVFLNMLRNYEEARHLLARAQQLDPSYPDAHGNMAFSLRRLGHDSAADRELNAATALELAAELGDVRAENGTDPVYVAPPDDWGLAYFRLTRKHPQKFLDFYRRYQDAAVIPLDREFVTLAPSGSLKGGSSPRAVLSRRDEASQAALERCEAAVDPPPSPCPFGSAISHPSCAGAPSAAEARLLQLKYEKEICRCNLGRAARDVKNHKRFVEEQRSLFQEFDEEWTPQIEDQVSFWRRNIRTLNELYADARPEMGRFVYPWPEQFSQLLTSHDEEMKSFSSDWIVFENDEYRVRLDDWRSWQDKCAEADAAFEAYLTEFAFRGPIRCSPITGNTYELKLPWIKVAYFIPDSVRGDIGFNLDVDLSVVKGGYWSSAEGASGGKVGGDVFGVFNPKMEGLASAEVWWRSGGDWGVGTSVEVVGNLLPKSIRSSQYKKDVVDNLVGTSTNYDPALGSTGITGWESKIGISKLEGAPPAWVRIRAKARKSDNWPLGRRTGKIQVPDC